MGWGITWNCPLCFISLARVSRVCLWVYNLGSKMVCQLYVSSLMPNQTSNLLRSGPKHSGFICPSTSLNQCITHTLHFIASVITRLYIKIRTSSHNAFRLHTLYFIASSIMCLCIKSRTSSHNAFRLNTLYFIASAITRYTSKAALLRSMHSGYITVLHC